ncbi:MAG: ChbG/HpnK family deacetylase [Candidatus Omnitrophota bacterium]
MFSKRLIITADDFGLAEGINAGIAKAFKAGIVRCASLSACGGSFENAAKIAKSTGLEIGAHLTFLEERPVLGPEKVPFIVGKSGSFLDSLPGFISTLYVRKEALKNIESEAKAQIEKILDTGIKPVFLNSHRHLHMLPPLFRQFISLADKYGIKAIRLANEYPIRNHLFDKNTLFRWPGVLLLKSLSAFNKKYIRSTGLKYNDYSAGILRSGHLDLEAVTAILKEIPLATTEFICHPAAQEDALPSYKHWRYDWQQELAVLLSPALKKKMTEERIEPIGFKDL